MKKTEFRKKATMTVTDAFMKAYSDSDNYQVIVKANKTYSHVDISGGSVSISVNINNKGVTYVASDFLYNLAKMVYYQYNEDDNHEEIIKKMRKDFYKLVKESNKYGHMIEDTLIGEHRESEE